MQVTSCDVVPRTVTLRFDDSRWLQIVGDPTRNRVMPLERVILGQENTILATYEYSRQRVNEVPKFASSIDIKPKTLSSYIKTGVEYVEDQMRPGMEPPSWIEAAWDIIHACIPQLQASPGLRFPS